MYKTEFISGEWCITFTRAYPKDSVVAKIPHHYREDKALAESIAQLLNDNNKIVINLSI